MMTSITNRFNFFFYFIVCFIFCKNKYTDRDNMRNKSRLYIDDTVCLFNKVNLYSPMRKVLMNKESIDIYIHGVEKSVKITIKHEYK